MKDAGYTNDRWVKVADGGVTGFVNGIYLKGDETGGVTVSLALTTAQNTGTQGTDTLTGIGVLGQVAQGTLDLWTKCTSTTPVQSPTCMVSISDMSVLRLKINSSPGTSSDAAFSWGPFGP